jgi:peptide/nickel transport system substrate-binding protein
MTKTRLLALCSVAALLAAGCSGADTSGGTTTPTTQPVPVTDDGNSTDGTTAVDDTQPVTSDSVVDEVVADDLASLDLPFETPPAVGDAGTVVWAVYRDLEGLNPLYAFDYPENTIISAMCESVLQQQPDGSIGPGLATLTRPDETTMVLDLRDDVTFWDGSPLTADDVVFSLELQRDPELGGFYGLAYSNVDTIEATGPLQVTLRLTQPDYWLEGELASIGAAVISQAYAATVGEAYGTPDGGAMCTGPYQLENWAVGDRVSVVRYDGYWGGAALTERIEFIGVPDDNALSAGLMTGDIDGVYGAVFPTLDQLEANPALTVTHGPSFAESAFIVSSLEGPLGDVNVRRALSMAIDRQGIIDALFKGAGIMPRSLANPGSWGYAPEVFRAGWAALPAPTLDVEAGKQAVTDAGMSGQKIVIGMTNEIPAVATSANAIKSAAESIGLEVELQSVSAVNYIDYFIDPAAFTSVDGFFTINYPDYADPAALYSTFAMPDGSQNYSGYANDQVTELMNQARGTADPVARAELVVQAEVIIMDELPWIPLVAPQTVLVTNAELTGVPASFSYMFAPWPLGLGTVG